MAGTQPSAQSIKNLIRGVISPILRIERTMVVPPSRSRHENVGEHSFSLGVLACALAPHYDAHLDLGKIAQYALVHDLVEVYAGDVTVWASDEALRAKTETELLAAKLLAKDYPDFPWIYDTYMEYETGNSPEKRFVTALDKIYPHILILNGLYHPVHPSWEAYARTEVIARQKIATYPALLPLFDDLCRQFREHPEFFATPIPQSEHQG